VDYPDAFAGWNYVASIGAYIGGVSVLIFLYVLYRTFSSKPVLANNYWGAGATTLEWSVSSPPPFHTFEELPRIR
jgi:cytochrome c oxidase subunit 1